MVFSHIGIAHMHNLMLLMPILLNPTALFCLEMGPQQDRKSICSFLPCDHMKVNQNLACPENFTRDTIQHI